MLTLHMLFERGTSRECARAKDAAKGLQLHMRALRVVFEVRDSLERLATARE